MERLVMVTGRFPTSASRCGGTGNYLRTRFRAQLQVLVQGLLGDPEHLAQLSDRFLPTIIGLKEELLLLESEFERPAAVATTGPSASGCPLIRGRLIP